MIVFRVIGQLEMTSDGGGIQIAGEMTVYLLLLVLCSCHFIGRQVHCALFLLQISPRLETKSFPSVWIIYPNVQNKCWAKFCPVRPYFITVQYLFSCSGF